MSLEPDPVDVLFQRKLAELEAGQTDRITDSERAAVLEAVMGGGYLSAEARQWLAARGIALDARQADAGGPPSDYGSAPLPDSPQPTERTTEPPSQPTVTRMDNMGMLYDAPAPVGWNNRPPDKPKTTYTEAELWTAHLEAHGNNRRRAIASWRRPTPSSSVIYPDFPLRRCVPPFQE